jgi:NADH-quinone oxidoreductase subunit J
MGMFLFILLSLLCIGAVLGMILSRNPAYSALFVVLAFAGTAGLFGLLDAPFIAVVQIIIYAGAIMVLFVFVIMMIDIKSGIPAEKKKGTLYAAGALGIFLLAELLFSAARALGFLNTPPQASAGSTADLGEMLFTKYLYPFEITSLLIIAALAGAMILSKKKANP